MSDAFHKFAVKVSSLAGSPWAFILAVLTLLVWGILGPVYNYSDSWQLFINTGGTIATLVMVFLIQNTQNRDAKAIHLKLDELIHGVKGARTGMVDTEDMSDEELEKLHEEFKILHEKYASELQKRKKSQS